MPQSLDTAAKHLATLYKVCAARLDHLSAETWHITEIWDWHDGPVEWVARANEQWWVCSDTLWIERPDLPSVVLNTRFTMAPRMYLTRAVRVTEGELSALREGTTSALRHWNDAPAADRVWILDGHVEAVNGVYAAKPGALPDAWAPDPTLCYCAAGPDAWADCLA